MKQHLVVLISCLLSLVNVASGQQDVRISRSVEQSGSAVKPTLVVFVFDRSSSMADPLALAGGHPDYWSQVSTDAQEKLTSFQSSLKSFDLRMYWFDSDASVFASPREQMTVGNADDAKSACRSIRGWPLPPRQGMKTNLWNSLSAVFNGLSEWKDLKNYANVIVVVFSDGKDSPKSASNREDERRALMQASMQRLRKRIETRLSVLPIGEWQQKQNAEMLEGLRSIADIAEVGKPIVVPSVVRYRSEPSAINLSPFVERGANQKFQLVFQGFDPTSISGASVAVRGANSPIVAKIESRSASAATVAISSAGSADSGFSGILDIQVPQSDSIQTFAVNIVVPPVKRIASEDQWGLPQRCESIGRRVALARVGEPFELALALPVDAKVKWWIDGKLSDSGAGSRLSITPSMPGESRIRVDVSNPDDAKTAEFTLFAIDPTVRIIGLDQIGAGDPGEYRLSDPKGLPETLAGLLGPVEWSGTSVSDAEKADVKRVRFDRKGTERLVARRTLSICGSVVEFEASKSVTVVPGPAVRLVGTEIVRGIRKPRVEAEVSERSRIAQVVFEIDGRRYEAPISAADGDGPSIAAVELTEVPAAKRSISVRVIPVLKQFDTGKPLDASHPECIARADEQEFSVIDPDAILVLESPTDGATLQYGNPVELKFKPEGRHVDDVAGVNVEIKSERGATETHLLSRQGGWKKQIVPKVDMGGSLTVHAKISWSDPTIPGAEFIREHKLGAPVPELSFGPELNSGALTWSGRNGQPPSISSRVVISGTEQLYPVDMLSDVQWTHESLQRESAINDNLGVVLTASTPGVFTVTASLKMKDGKAYLLSREIAIRPDPVIAGPVLKQPRFAKSDGVIFDHSATSGAWVGDPIVRLKREIGDWMVIKEGDTVASPDQNREEPIHFEVWYRPWGVSANETPWTPQSGWVRSSEISGTAVPPRDWTGEVIASVLGLIIAGFMVNWYRGNDLRYRSYKWEVQPQVKSLDQNFQEVANWSWPDEKLSFDRIRKVMKIQLPSMDFEVHGPVDWLGTNTANSAFYVALTHFPHTRASLVEGENTVSGGCELENRTTNTWNVGPPGTDKRQLRLTAVEEEHKGNQRMDRFKCFVFVVFLSGVVVYAWMTDFV